MLLLVCRSITNACLSNCSNNQTNKKAKVLHWKQYYNTRVYLISFSRLPVSEAAKHFTVDLDSRNVHSFLSACPPPYAESPDYRKSTRSYHKYVCAFYSKHPLSKRSFLFLSWNSPSFKAHLILSHVSELFTVSLSCCVALLFKKTFAWILSEGNNPFWIRFSFHGWQSHSLLFA